MDLKEKWFEKCWLVGWFVHSLKSSVIHGLLIGISFGESIRENIPRGASIVEHAHSITIVWILINHFQMLLTLQITYTYSSKHMCSIPCSHNNILIHKFKEFRYLPQYPLKKYLYSLL